MFNARNLRLAHNRLARQYAASHGLRMGAGSDSHLVREVGQAFVDLPEFQTATELLVALDTASIHGRRSNPAVHLRTAVERRLKRRQAEREAVPRAPGSGG